ncbi:hypothetical protein [Komagataeibacter sp. FNDCR2]|uniref:hypothetical protein n=1 Tax=Komagataeibacter sp. FNDCR2 TaxID=2878682 RepID=UPI001E358AA5|nr:hypothetical protein [Komagataeibacter sp. FNDCR2]MCE2576142.1 hypothetical protein [Komagataeibacter sp. FNDCR2]
MAANLFAPRPRQGSYVLVPSFKKARFVKLFEKSFTKNVLMFCGLSQRQVFQTAFQSLQRAETRSRAIGTRPQGPSSHQIS